MLVQVLEYIMVDKLWYIMGIVWYSDFFMIVFGLVVECIIGMFFEVLIVKEIYELVSVFQDIILVIYGCQLFYFVCFLWEKDSVGIQKSRVVFLLMDYFCVQFLNYGK